MNGVSKWVAALMFAALSALIAEPVAQSSAELELRAAMETETVRGDLKSAIEQYRKIAQRADRAIAARAMVRMAECYQKLGDAEAKKIFERVIKEYADQAEPAAQARTRLASLERESSGSRATASNRLIWTAPKGADFYGKVSPDGRYVPFVDMDQNDDLFLHDLTTGTARRLTKGESGDFAEEAAISRDGKQLAYSWFNAKQNQYNLRLIGLQGSGIPHSRELLARERDVEIDPYDWAPDGKRLAISIVRKDGTRDLGMVSVDDESVRVFKSVPWPGPTTMSFSPDGRYLAFDVPTRDSGARDVLAIAIEDGREIPVAVHRANDALVGWSPDGTHVVFASDRSGTNSLWMQSFAAGRTTGPPQWVRADIGRLDLLGLSAAGALYSFLYYDRVDVDIRVGTFDFGTGQMLSAPVEFVRDYSAGSVSQADWSPNGREVGYLSQRNSLADVRPDVRLVVRSLETTQVQELRPKMRFMQWFRWAPDGRSFVAQGMGFTGERGLWHIDRTTGETTPLYQRQPDAIDVAGSWSDFPGWSADSRKVYYRRIAITPGKESPPVRELLIIERDLASATEREVFRGYQRADPFMTRDKSKLYYRRPLGATPGGGRDEVAFMERDLATGRERELTRGFLGGPWLSPDAQYIATGRSDESSHSRSILLIQIADGSVRELMRVDISQSGFTNPSANLNSLAGVFTWSPDGRSILVRKNFGDGRAPEIWWVPTSGNERPKLVTLIAPGEQLPGTIRIHPDGRRIAFDVATRPAPTKLPEVWVLDNFIPASAAKN